MGSWKVPALAVVAAISLSASQAGVATIAADGPEFYVGGIQVHELDHDRWVETVRDVGMNAVAVTVYAKQGAWDSDHLWFEDSEPAVLDEIRTAKAQGLAVVLVLRVAVDHAYPENKFIWHGMIMPRSPELIRSWFETYERFVVKWARIAQAEGVDVLGIGSEMNALTETLPISRWGNMKNYYGYYWYQRLSRKRGKRFSNEIEDRHLWVRGYENHETLDDFLDARFDLTVDWARNAYLRPGPHTLRRINDRRRLIDAEWVSLIGETRRVFDGKLTYAANFDSYYDVGFWSHLDVMGINAYFSLRPNLSEADDPSQQRADFVTSWEGILGRIEAFKKAEDIEAMPFIFTELGYTFRRHSTVEPWSHGGFSVVGWKGHARQLVVWGEQSIDYDERRLALEALHEVHVKSDSDLRGLLYWKLSTDRTHEAIEPFVLHIGADSEDRLQEVLARFAATPPSRPATGSPE